VATQIANHLKAVGGKFKGDELVLVMAGGNDALFQLGALSAAATAAGTTAGSRPTCQPGQPAGGRATNPQTAAAAITAAVTGSGKRRTQRASPWRHRRCGGPAGRIERGGRRVRPDRRGRRPTPPLPAPKPAPTTPPPTVRNWWPRWARPAPNWWRW
jgi:hypothetical protein